MIRLIYVRSFSVVLGVVEQSVSIQGLVSKERLLYMLEIPPRRSLDMVQVDNGIPPAMMGEGR